MYRKQVRRRRAILVLLVVACLALISTQFSEGDEGPLHSIQDGVSTVLGPVQEGASRALKPARDLVNWFDETFDARGDNETLEDQVAALRSELLATQRAAERAGYAEDVAKLVDQGSLTEYEPVDAIPIARSYSLWFGALTIDEGSSAGIAVDDTVITGDGLVGRISSVSGNVARVTLLTDGRSAVAARVAGRGPEGLVEPEVGSPGELLFSLFPVGKDVERGDKLVTAGFTDADGTLSSRFPAEIPIGEVVEARAEGQDQSQSVRVEPFVDLGDLPELTVLTGGPP